MSTDHIASTEFTAASRSPTENTDCSGASGEPDTAVTDRVIHERFWARNRERAALVPYVLPLLAKGEPVTLDEIAGAASWSVDDVEAELRRHGSVEWDERGRVAGFGLTLRPTPQRFTFDGRTVYGWCATDTLVFPVALGRSGVVDSTCAATGQPIRIEVTPARVEKVDPSSAVVSLVRPEEVGDIRVDVCNAGRFFASPEAAADWLAAHPAGMVHTVEEDFELNRETFERFGWANLGH